MILDSGYSLRVTVEAKMEEDLELSHLRIFFNENQVEKDTCFDNSTGYVELDPKFKIES